jgi:hypothetical protein
MSTLGEYWYDSHTRSEFLVGWGVPFVRIRGIGIPRYTIRPQSRSSQICCEFPMERSAQRLGGTPEELVADGDGGHNKRTAGD